MHLALVLSSTYDLNEQVVTLPTSESNRLLVRGRLQRRDAGFHVESLPGDRDFPEALEERFAQLDAPLDSLFLYYSGYIALKEGRSPALLLDGERLRAYPLPRLFRALERAAENVFVVLDTAAMADGGQPPDVIADAIADEVPYGGKVSCLLGSRGVGAEPHAGPSPFTSLFLVAMDRVIATTDAASATASSLFDIMRAEVASFSRLEAAAYRVGLSEFSLRPGAQLATSTGIRPVAPAGLPPASWPPVSLPPPSATGFEKLPSFDDDVGPVWAPPSSAPPAPRPSIAPTVASITADARRLSDGGDLPGALEQFDRALLFCDPDDRHGQAELAIEIATALEKAGHGAEALLKLEEALDADPTNVIASGKLTESLVRRGDFRGIEELTRRRLPSMTSTEQQADALWRLATTWIDSARDLPSGVRVLEELLTIAPGDRRALERLVQTLEAVGDHGRAVGARCRLAEIAPTPEHRAELFANTVKICIEQMGDIARAGAVALRACADDPGSAAALHVVAAELARREAWGALASFYESVLDQLTNVDACTEVLKRLGDLRRRKLGDVPGALDALERAASLDPSNVAVHLTLAELYDKRGVAGKSLEHVRRAISLQPSTPEVYRRALDNFRGLGHADGTWNAANALVALGAADEATKELARTAVDDSLMNVERAMEEDDWQDRVFSADADPAMSELMRAVSDAAIAIRIRELEKSKDHFVPDPALRHDVEKSTATLVRSLIWTTRLLSTHVPDIYIYPKTKRAMAALQAHQPTTLVSRTLGSGLSLPELCFLWGRHVTFFRPELRLLIFYSTTRDLAGLTLAALTLGKGSDDALSALERETKKLAKGLKKELGESGMKRLAKIVDEFPKQNTSARVLAWARSAELFATRAGVIACGDAAIAVELLRRFPLGGITSEEEQVDDLLTYSLSDQYLELRERIGVSVSRSQRATG